MQTPLVKPQSTEGDSELEELVKFFDETLGFCPNSVKTMYKRPRIAYAFIELNKAVMENKGGVSSSLKRLVGYLSSYAAGCQYCQAHTIRAAERYGADAVQMENIWDYKTHPAFNDAERAALDFAVAASTIPNAVDNTIADNLRKHWNDGEITELTGVVALFGFLNRWNDSMGTELEKGALESGEKYLAAGNWTGGKHIYY
jgi:uncharacterized peroxidase-related enzyme